MVGWPKERILLEIKRQIAWAIATIERMEHEKQAIEQANRKLLARRRSYKAKNNGKGRPPKLLGNFSNDRQLRLLRLKVEANLLIQLLPQLINGQDPLLILEARVQQIPSSAHDGVSLMRAGKLRGLLKQFRQQAVPLAKSSLTWREKDVRHYFVLLAKVQKAKMRVLSAMVLRTQAEKIENDRHHAMTLLLDSFLHSNHLQSPDHLRRAIEVWRHGPPSFKAQVSSRWSRTWRETIEEAWRDLTRIFAVASPS